MADLTVDPEVVADFVNTVAPILAAENLAAEMHTLRWHEAISFRRRAVGGNSVNVSLPGNMAPRTPGTALPANADPAPIVSDLDAIANIPIHELGDHSQFSDRIVRARNISYVEELIKQLTTQAVETLNAWRGNAAMSGTHELFGGGAADLANLFSGNNLRPQDFSRAAAHLKGNDGSRPVRPFDDGKYRAFLHPLQVLDMFEDAGLVTAFKDAINYNNPENLLSGEIGEYLGFRVVEAGSQQNYASLAAGGGNVDAVTALFCGYGFLGEAEALPYSGVTGPHQGGDKMGRFWLFRYRAELGWAVGKDRAGIKVTTTAANAVAP